MSELEPFLRAARARGAQDSVLVELLKESGWPASAVYEALGRIYAEETGLPVPLAKGRMESAREAFYHLLAFLTLGTWICSTGSIWFTLIDTWLPDAAAGGYYRYWRWSRVSWEMASLIVAFPAFGWATRSILNEMEANPDKAGSAIRRWLTNIALLLTALVFIGDLVSFVAALLQGELTARFVLKSITIFVLAGAVFLYYSRGLAKSTMAPRTWHRAFGAVSVLAILVSLGFAFVKTGSPAEARLRAEDNRRVRDLHKIAEAVHNDWLRLPDGERKLPASLAELNNTGLVLRDPFTQAPYEYVQGKGETFSVCAVFSAATSKLPDGTEPSWPHPVGRHCYEWRASRAPAYPALFD